MANQKRTTIIYFIATLFMHTSLSFAQDSSKMNPHPLPLEELKGFTPTIQYSPGQEARAKSIASFMEGAVHFFQKQIKFTPLTTIYILAPQHWKNFAAKPLQDVYGFPHNIDSKHLAVASEDNDFWRSFLPPPDQVPPAMAAQVQKAYGQTDGSVSMKAFFDLLALHEMGHSYTAQAGLKTHRKWMGELFVNIMLHTYVAEKQPELLPALETFPNIVVDAGSAEYKYTSLADFEALYETLGMGPRNYGWYQCKLHSAAKDIYNAGGKKTLQKLWKALKKHQEEMSDTEFANMLKNEVHPSVASVYLNWGKTQ